MRQPILVLNAGQHLKEMEADGIEKRRDFHEVPPHVEYALTSFGQSLRMALAPPCESGTHHMKRIETAQGICRGEDLATGTFRGVGTG